jgi:hypothetical protein
MRWIMRQSFDLPTGIMRVWWVWRCPRAKPHIVPRRRTESSLASPRYVARIDDGA